MIWRGLKLAQDKDADASNGPSGVALFGFGCFFLLSAADSALRNSYVPGAKTRWRNERGVDPEQLRAGIKTEMEHTDDYDVAKEIALDHLIGEDPKYYSKLRKARL